MSYNSIMGDLLLTNAATSRGDYAKNKKVSWIVKSSRNIVYVMKRFQYLILRCFSPWLLYNTFILEKIPKLKAHSSCNTYNCGNSSLTCSLNADIMKERSRVFHLENEMGNFDPECETTHTHENNYSSTTLLLDEVCERKDQCYVAEELDVSFLELSDSEEDSDLEVENMEYEMSFNIESPNETEESYRQRGKHRQDSIVIEVSDTEEGITTPKGTARTYWSSSCFDRDYTSPIDTDFNSKQQTYQHPIFTSNSLEERQRKVFCDSESNQWDSQDSSFYSNSFVSSGGLHSLKFQENLDCKEYLRVSEKVICWEENAYVDMSEHDVNCIVENITENFHSSQEQKSIKPLPEKLKGKVDFEDLIQHDVKNEIHPFLCIMLCAFLLNLSVIAAVFTQSKENVLKFQVETLKKKKKKRKILHVSKRKKRQRQRILREIINWQISLRRNTTVMYDFQTQNIYPSRTTGNTRLNQIANEGLEGGERNDIVQSRPAEADPSIGEQMQNGILNGNFATFPRYVAERNQTGNMDANRQFYSSPTMGTERPQVDPLTRSLPAIYTVVPQVGDISVTEALPVIEESENSSLRSTENNAVPLSEEGQSQGRTTEEAISNPSHPSVPPEADGASMTSTETLSSFFSSVSLSSVEEDEAFRYEWIRLKTFSSWPLTSLFSTVMARGGWVALGEGDGARCYSCHVVHEGWKIGDNPLDFHDRHCRFLQSVSDNVPIIREEPTPTLRTIERDRERLPESSDVVPQGNVTQQVPRSEEENRNIVMNLMSKDVGEPFQEERGNLVAVSSNPRDVTSHSEVSCNPRDVTPNLENSERPPAYNSSYTSRPPPQLVAPVESNPVLKHSPSNPQGYSAAGPPPLPSGREAQLEALRRDPMGINFDRPKYPSYAILAVRISSFTDWPASMTQTPRDMALAGFFYAGYGDYTRCFFCGGGLRNWEAGDDPWVEHARWFSKCAFVRQNRGQQFIDLVLRRAAEMEEQRSQDEAGNSQTNTQTSNAAQALSKEEKIMKSAAVISIKDMGYSEETIKTAITTIKSRLPRGKHKVSAQEILEVIFELADSQRASENSSSQSEPQRNVDQSESSSTPAVQSEAITENVTNNISQSASTTDKTDQSTGEETATTGASNAGEAGTGENISNFLSNPTFDELTSLRQENTSLKDQIICKICMEKNVSIAFLPCGHLACCADCAPAMRKCPICREFVRGTVKTYLV
ncbi:uncharacterized protein LOC133180760 isoform X2 [Saccostrea echinata]|uniref:uncharacterized protein LOC133180760 isoform X2 n=1 Tax=Saccostrea echinata TaxID=191078 RepID=UPI002A8008C2|nr:uncharacterized protein LOC133180760 isoform X2 [Saccostrea echinata]